MSWLTLIYSVQNDIWLKLMEDMHQKLFLMAYDQGMHATHRLAMELVPCDMKIKR